MSIRTQCLKLGTVAAAATAVAVANAMVFTNFESFTASAAGTAVAGQGGFYTPAVTGAVDGAAFTFAGNALGFPNNPMGGSKFVGGNNPGTPSLIRMQVDNTFPNAIVKVEYDTCAKYSGTLPGTQNVGSVSFQDSTLQRFFILLMVWVDPLTCTNWSQQFNVYDAAGVALNNQSPAAEWANLNLDAWYKNEVYINMVTNQITRVAITNLSTGVRTVNDPAAWYLTGGSAPTLPAPTAARLFIGGTTAGNTAGFDNFVIAGNPSSPTAYTINQGTPFGGNVASLGAGDNNYLFVLNDESDPNTSVSATGSTGVSNSTNVGAIVEFSAARNDLTVFGKMRNYGTNALLTAGSSVTSSVDKILHMKPTGTFTNASGNFEVVVDMIPQADLEAADGWSVQLDRIEVFAE